ncbi:ChrR family anti-sigma-E factor [Mycoplana sp. MJR14]|uniref:ChrR family anti-sigma-E factor n=1 Tax=Mycoplana sp. MJR14 TaxID=3032583 RepID=UPI0023DBD95E|nr:ChrR family anti-sigma-E factor [Mycoplana sp. MJR14]MDF1631110.1 ChrR family anti-sigma-E factor [Mycoplana sp. MJR14]
MTIRHHVSDELLLAYAAGTLEEGWRLAVATHLALCPDCRKRLSVMEDAGGQLLEDITPELAMSTSFEHLRQRILHEGAPVRPAPAGVRPTASDHVASPVLPEPLRSYVGGDVETLKWRSLGRGAYHIPVKTADGTTMVRLLRIPAGKPVPEHGHGGRELTLVLSGSFYDGEELFARGDLEEADANVQHQPLATPGEDCICLAVTDAPLKFKSWLVRLVQPVLGI